MGQKTSDKSARIPALSRDETSADETLACDAPPHAPHFPITSRQLLKITKSFDPHWTVTVQSQPPNFLRENRHGCFSGSITQALKSPLPQEAPPQIV
ncbi:hypothetical protein VNO77_31908 [Canavalia gladiata]|uniref:Uncharacterized protein n=1 Tax=Canavalia gladiata TaxID=3824 RepID=A0AAN9Q7Y6_CANGL